MVTKVEYLSIFIFNTYDDISRRIFLVGMSDHMIEDLGVVFLIFLLELSHYMVVI